MVRAAGVIWMSNEVLFLGGIFNYVDPFFGVQIYLWAFLAIVVLGVVAWIAWRYGMWEPYKPVWGLYYAFKAVSQAAFIFNSGLVAELLSERDAKCIFDYANWKYTGIGRIQKWLFNYATVFLPDLPLAKAILYKYGGRNLDVEIAKKMQNYEWEKYSSVTLGGIHTDMILDADNWSVRDTPQHKIIESECEKWNDANPDDQIHAYSKYMRYTTDGDVPRLAQAEGVKYRVLIPWSRIDSAFPTDGGDNEDAGAVRQFAREMEEQDNNNLSKYYIPVLAGGVGIILMLLATRIVGMLL